MDRGRVPNRPCSGPASHARRSTDLDEAPRSLLAAYAAEIVVLEEDKPRRSWLRVDRLRFSAFRSRLWLYPEIQRLRIA